MQRNFSISLFLVFSLSLLAGCMSSDTNHETDPDGMIEPPETDEESTSGGEANFERRRVVANGLVMITEPTDNRVMQINYMEHAWRLDSCKQLIDGLTYADEAWFQYTVWNRTGLVEYHEFPVPRDELDKPFNVSLELPDDPPFLVQPKFCTMELFVDFYAYDYFFVVQGREPVPMERDQIERKPISMAERTSYEVRIPPFEKTGIGTLSLEGDLYFLEQPAMPDPQEGFPYGDFWFFEPGDDSDWIYRGELRPHYRDWWGARLVGHSKPGEYRFEVELTNITPIETVWEVDHWVYRFNENIAEYGFKYPFVNYV